MTKDEFLFDFKRILQEEYSLEPEEASIWQIHNAIGKVILSRYADHIRNSRRAHEQSRRACYFSAEFLVGLSLIHI